MTNEEIITQLKDIKCHCQEMYEAEIKNGDPSSSIWGKDVEALNLAIQALESQPKWIPTSERLPEEFQQVLVTTRSTRTGVCTYLKGSAYWKSYVNAWMPLPQPYKGGDEE